VEPAVSVIVPAVRADNHLRACLTSVSQMDPGAELVVAVDGGDREAVALARAHGARVVVLTIRRGPAAARNAAVRVARGRVLVFIDADVTVRPDLVARVLDALAGPPACNAVIGSYDDLPAETNFLSQYKNLAHHFTHQTARDEASTFWGACGAITRDAFNAVGGFDERYRRPSIEDIALGAQLRRAGFRIRLVASLQVTHLKRWTAQTLWRSDVFDRAVPWTRLVLETRLLPDDLNLRWSRRAAVAAACLLLGALAVAPWRPWMLAVAAGLAVAQVALDARLAVFFWRRRGTLFAVRAMAWHWLHNLCCALGLAVGVGLYVAEKLRRIGPAPVIGRALPVAGESERK
jgi:GT2 family glycosyltransferase